MASSMTYRARCIRNRWLSLISCALISASIWMLIREPLNVIATPLVSQLGRLPALLIALLAEALLAYFCWIFGRSRFRGFFGIRHFLSFPPLWVAAILSLMILAIAEWIYSGADSVITRVEPILAPLSMTIVILASVLSILLICHIAFKYLQRIPAFSKHFSSDKSDTQSSGFIDWIRHDHEIASQQQDRFEHDIVARRIARRLSATNEKPPTMALVGPQGSGKSSIRCLVEHHLANNPRVELIAVSLWPFESPDAAVSGIIRSLVRSLAKHVNTLSAAGISDKYLQTIGQFGGFWKSISQMLSSDSTPLSLLQRLTTISAACDIHLVLWIEDLERFSSVRRGDADNYDSGDVRHVGPILALIHLLDTSESISLVVADSSLNSCFDVSKIARFVEEPTRLTTEYVWEQIAELRRVCSPSGIVDPASEVYRKQLALVDTATSIEKWFLLHLGDDASMQHGIARLLDTPRSLKWALRLTWEAWTHLAGEIDFDSVLVASAIRVGRPRLFSFIIDNIELFRHGFKGVVTASDKKPHPLRSVLEELLSAKNEIERKGILNTLDFLFPAALREYEANDFVESPQALSSNRHTDYWRRYLTLPEISPEDSDQAALAAIFDWKSRRENDLSQRMMSAPRSAQISSFVRLFTISELCQLLVEITTLVADDESIMWEDRYHPNGITAIYHMMQYLPSDQDALTETIESLMKKYAGVHLLLVNELLHWFDGSRGHTYITAEQQTQVNELLIKLLVMHYGSVDSDDLLAALGDGSHYLMHWLCMRRSDVEVAVALPFSEWPKISNALLSAAESDVVRGLPYIVPFVVNNWVFQETSAKCLFDVERLWKILKNVDADDWANEIVRKEITITKAGLRASMKEAKGDDSPEESDESSAEDGD